MKKKRRVFAKVPDSVILEVFSYLETSEICRVAQVCQRWKRIARDRSLWLLAEFDWTSKDSIQAFLDLGTGANIRRLRFFKCLLTPEMLTTVLDACKSVQELTLQYCYLYDWEDVVRMDTYRQLITLDIRGIGGNTTFVCGLMCNLPNLENLAFDNNFSEQFSFKNTPKLRILDCSRSLRFTDVDVARLALTCPALESLSLMKCFNVRGETLPLLLSQCQSLKSLSLAYLHIEDKTLSVCDWENCSLVELDMSYSPRLRLDGFTRMITGMPKLTYLNLASSGDFDPPQYLITGKTLGYFYHLKSLKVLDLNAMNSTKDSEDKLCDVLAQLPELESLTIGTVITTATRLDRCLSQLPDLKRFGITSPEAELLETDINVEHVLTALATHCLGLLALGLYSFPVGRWESRDKKAFLKIVTCCKKLSTMFFVSGDRRGLMNIAENVVCKLDREVRFVTPELLTPVVRHVTLPPSLAFHGVVYGKESDNINYWPVVTHIATSIHYLATVLWLSFLLCLT